MSITVDLERCTGNGECVKSCAFAAVEVRDGKAVIFDNCTDCGACVIACPTKALWSDLFSIAAKAAVLAVDFSSASGISDAVERAARRAEASATWFIADASDAGVAADAIAATARDGGYSLVVLPHSGAGPAIAGRVAAELDAHLVAGCADLRIDDDGSLRAARPRFGGIVKSQARCAPGLTVATLYPRAVKTISAPALGATAALVERISGSVDVPISAQRRVIVIASMLSDETREAARALASSLGAAVVGANEIGSKPISPDLAMTIGVGGSTELNSALRNSRVLVAVVDDVNAPIVQLADYVLAGDVEAHVKALVANL
jgi:electron transfer flavoprotein alpha subunit